MRLTIVMFINWNNIFNEIKSKIIKKLPAQVMCVYVSINKVNNSQTLYQLCISFLENKTSTSSAGEIKTNKLLNFLMCIWGKNYYFYIIISKNWSESLKEIDV